MVHAADARGVQQNTQQDGGNELLTVTSDELLILDGHLHRAVVHPLIVVRRRRARQDSIGVFSVVHGDSRFPQLLAEVVGALEGAVSATQHPLKNQRV